MDNRDSTFIPDALAFQSLSKMTAGNAQAPSSWSFGARPEVRGTLWHPDGRHEEMRVLLTNEESTALEELLNKVSQRASRSRSA